ncbi:MAG: GGDEF domain-containing protein [Fimbriimonadaceae bacterium]|nr:GGDEF domain-containing protein [Fimbriimonadaceae bacterium]
MMIAFVGITVWTKRNERTTKILRPVFLISLLVLITGTVTSNSAVRSTVDERLKANLGSARLMASELQNHYQSSTNDGVGQEFTNKASKDIVERWLKANPEVTGVKAIRKTPDGKFQTIVLSGNNESIDSLLSRGPVFGKAWEGTEVTMMPNRSNGEVFSAIPLQNGNGSIHSVLLLTFSDPQWSAVIERAQSLVVMMTAVLVFVALFGGLAVAELIHALAIARVAKAEMLLQGDQIKEQMELIAEKNQTMAANQDLLAQANSRLHALATMDGLTGLMNHRTLMEFLSTSMKRNSVVGSPSSVILLDIDNFKQLNDQYGHLAGDEALRAIGQVLRQSCPPGAAVGRYGGEEFMMVLPGGSESAAVAVAEELRRRIQATPTTSRQVTTSIGVSTVYSMSKSEQTLIGEADSALYYSKRNGKNRVTHYGHGLLDSASA